MSLDQLDELRKISIEKCEEFLGFHLTRSKWDPYPWVSKVDRGSPACTFGVREGDCVLEVNDRDIVGLKISEVAEIVKNSSEKVDVLLWNAGVDENCSQESICCGPITSNLQRLSACIKSILTFLECPICFDTISPPTYQCDNGHLICIRCRAKSERCPVCRLRLSTGRSLLSDQIYNSLIDSFHLREHSNEIRQSKIHQIFRQKNRQKGSSSNNNNIPDIKVTPSHTNKFLARLSGKASSDDNINSNYFLSASNSRDPQNVSISNNLKMKSLSTNEIFKSDSTPSVSVVSRSSSSTRLNRKERAFLLNINMNPTTTNNNNNYKSASYHGSYESLNRKDTSESDSNINKQEISTLFYCPFDNNCSSLIKGSENEIMGHFQESHSQNALIQYFTSHVHLPFKKIIDDTENCFVINIEDEIYFLKTLTTNNNNSKDIVLWAWHIFEENHAKNLDILIEIRKKSHSFPLVSLRNPIYSLSDVSSNKIEDCKRGVIFSGILVESLGNYDELSLVVQILKDD